MKAFLKKIFLFRGTSDEEIDRLCDQVNFNLKSYSRGDKIYTPESYTSEIGFVYLGECEVRCCKSEGKTILNTIKVGDSFGILAALGKKEFPTEIYAKRNSSVLFLSSEDLLHLINSSPKIALNVIDFLSDKVTFLNKKINTVTKGCVDKKLAAYLITSYYENEKAPFEVNLKKCSESINAGRASVYRSLESLKSKGYIQAENKIITILNLKQLEDFSK